MKRSHKDTVPKHPPRSRLLSKTRDKGRRGALHQMRYVPRSKSFVERTGPTHTHTPTTKTNSSVARLQIHMEPKKGVLSRRGQKAVPLVAVQLALLPRGVADGLGVGPRPQAVVEVHEAGHPAQGPAADCGPKPCPNPTGTLARPGTAP